MLFKVGLQVRSLAGESDMLRTGIVLMCVLSVIACENEEALGEANSQPPQIEIWLDRGSDECSPPCFERVVQSPLLGPVTVNVAATPNATLSGGDVLAVATTKLGSFDHADPDRVLWSATATLSTDAASELLAFAESLESDQRVLVTVDSEPSTVVYANGLGRFVRVGEFETQPAAERLARAFRPSTIFVAGDITEVKSRAQLERDRTTERLLDESVVMQQEVERIQRLANDGTISKQEMIERLANLRDQPPE